MYGQSADMLLQLLLTSLCPNCTLAHTGLVNVLGCYAVQVFFFMLVQNTEQRRLLFRTMGRIFSGMSDTAKAFIIIAVTDILLGYHSEEGWTAAIHLFTGHYGYEVEVRHPYNASVIA